MRNSQDTPGAISIFGGGRRRIWIAFAAIVLVAGCTTEAPPPPSEPVAEIATDVFAYGYREIAAKYVRPVRFETLVEAGLKGLSRIDPSISVSRAEGGLVVAVANETARPLPLPDGDDPGDWAELTLRAITTGRAISPQLRAAGAEDIYRIVFGRALAHLDRYSRYASTVRAVRQRDYREGFGGIGIRIDFENATVRIVSVVPDAPAERAGLKADDRITQIDGFTVAGLSPTEVVSRLRGPTNTEVMLTIDRAKTEDHLQVSVTRSWVVPQTVRLSTDRGVAHIRLSGFNQRTARNLAGALRQAKRELGANFKAVLLDLRGNPGGLLDQAIWVADMFLADGVILSTRGRHPASTKRYRARGMDFAEGRPVVVLIDGRSASSAEIVAAALQDLGRAVVIGTTSFGKGSVQTVFQLPNGGEIALTWSRIMTPSGYALDGLGILPSICLRDDGRAPAQLVAILDREMAAVRPMLKTWRQSRMEDGKQRRELRRICPPRPNLDDDAVEVARQLLADRQLHARALRSVATDNPAAKAAMRPAARSRSRR